MATASVTNTFSNGTLAQSAQVNTNFADLVSFINNETIHVDGSKAFTGNVEQPTYPAADDHLTKKLYVDVQMANSGIPYTLIDAAGDLLVASADNTIGRLAVGSSGQVLSVASGTAAWAGLGALPQPFFKSGNGPITAITSNGWLPANHSKYNGINQIQLNSAEIIFAGPFFVTKATQFDNLGWFSPADVGNARMAIYQAGSNGAPLTLLRETADTNTTTGSQSLAITAITLTEGLFYWLAIQVQNTTTFGAYGYNNQAMSWGHPWANPYPFDTRRWREAQSYGAFPATATPVVALNIGVPILWLQAV